MARVVCPSCKKAGNVPDEYLGNRIKCPNCGERFAAPTLPPPKGERTQAVTAKPAVEPVRTTPASEALELDVLHALNAAPAVIAAEPPSQATTKACLYCGESILAVALKCKHCGEILDPALRAAEEAKAIARQSAHAPIVNVSTAVSNTVGGVVVRRRVLSRILTVGVALIPFGMVLMSIGITEVGAVCSVIGMLMAPIGLVITAARLVTS